MDQHAPPVDDNLGPTTLAICTPIFALALLLYVIRVFPRMTPTIKLGYADYIVSLAVVSIASFALLENISNPSDSYVNSSLIPFLLP